MSTIKTPVHMYVDEMSITNGPSESALDALPAINHANWRQRRVKMTLTTAASKRPLNTKVTIMSVEYEYEDWYTVHTSGYEIPYDLGPKPTGALILKGFIGRWYFTGTYDPKTRTGTLKEDEYDPEEVAFTEEMNNASDYLLMQRGY